MAYIKIAITLPPDVYLWLKGYAAARGVSVSSTVAYTLVEKRSELKTLSKETQAIRSMLRKKRGD